mmetsp:Transcript_13538/g.26859  ORF Transcript_13538/g.26859 Transcript_13538/m.26859 type:complete len:109 (-) Transcript_13538:1815-2141(-)
MHTGAIMRVSQEQEKDLKSKKGRKQEMKLGRKRSGLGRKISSSEESMMPSPSAMLFPSCVDCLFFLHSHSLPVLCFSAAIPPPSTSFFPFPTPLTPSETHSRMRFIHG